MKMYVLNEEMSQWERIDRVQEYRGVKIETLSVHGDYSGAPNHRMYRTTTPSGMVTYRFINKREGGNIKDIKKVIDFKIKYNEL